MFPTYSIDEIAPTVQQLQNRLKPNGIKKQNYIKLS